MSLVDFEELPDSARLWVFGAERSPSPTETAHLLDRMESFLEEWTAHDRSLRAGFDWREHRFLMVGLDPSAGDASGCSIDALYRQIRSLEEELGTSMLAEGRVWLEDSRGRIRSLERSAFRRLAEAGEVGPGTVVFDLTVNRVEDVRRGRWRRPAGEGWHARLLPDGEPDEAEEEQREAT